MSPAGSQGTFTIFSHTELKKKNKPKQWADRKLVYYIKTWLRARTCKQTLTHRKTNTSFKNNKCPTKPSYGGTYFDSQFEGHGGGQGIQSMRSHFTLSREAEPWKLVFGSISPFQSRTPGPWDTVVHSQDGSHPLRLPSLETPSQMCPEVGLLGDSRSCPVWTITQSRPICRKREAPSRSEACLLIQIFFLC